MPIVERFSWFPRVALIGYAAMTIAGYLVMGPYFTLGWIAKGIEVALITSSSSTSSASTAARWASSARRWRRSPDPPGALPPDRRLGSLAMAPQSGSRLRRAAA